MNVVHIVGGDLTRGAHRGAYWLHMGMREIGLSSTILGSIPLNQQSDGIFSVSTSSLSRLKDRAIRKSDHFLLRAYPRRPKWSFSTGLFGRRIIDHKAIQCADVVNVHWTCKGPLSVRGLGELASTGKQIVWTLRDMWPFTGGCHYSMDCERYRVGCGMCPQLRSRCYRDLSRIVYRTKERHITQSIRIVGISAWLSECARRSRLMRDFNVTTIPNCVDTQMLTPVEKQAARKALDISTSKRIVLLGADNLHSFYKGFPEFLQAAQRLDPEKVMVLLFGSLGPSGVPQMPLEVKALGYLSDVATLRLAYSAADVFVAPYKQEAFGKTLVEAMACGTPVVCFDFAGPKDIVVHKVTGYKAVPFNSDDLADGIKWVLDASESDFAAATTTRAAAFDKQVVARQYAALYEEMLGQK